VSRTAQEYQGAVVMVAAMARLLAGYDVPGLLADIEHAEAIGPVLDPTLYRDKAKAMGEDRELLRAALPLYQLGKKLEASTTNDARKGTAP